MIGLPKPNDTPEMLALEQSIERQWQRTLRLQKAMVASDKREGLLRARLRLIQEGLVQGESLTLLPSGETGMLEVSADTPHLWLRLLDKNGAPSKRRLKIQTNSVVMRPDGSAPTPAVGYENERQYYIDRYHSQKAKTR